MAKMSLKSARVNAKLTQAQAAEALGISISTVKSYEKGKTFPQQPMIEKLCKLYKVNYDQVNFLA